MKTQRLQSTAAALMMAAILMTAASQAEAKKKAPETPPQILSTDSARPALRPETRYPEEGRLGNRISIEKDSMWMVLKHRFWV